MKKIVSLLLTCLLSMGMLTCALASYSVDEHIPSDNIILNYEFLSEATISEVDGFLILSRNNCISEYAEVATYTQDAVFIHPSEDSSVEILENEIENFLADAETSSLRSGGSKYESAYDSSGSVTGYVTIHYITDPKTAGVIQL